ncbi:hypothetical protein [Roseibium sp.]|uniref:hypothetical protein n=1 Tax=Roseibium sp. TaxID=1936156 RepID=UPI003B52156B
MKRLKVGRQTFKDVLKSFYYVFLSGLILITSTLDVNGHLPFSGITQYMRDLGFSQNTAGVIAFFFYLMIIGHGMNFFAKHLLRFAKKRHEAQQLDTKGPPNDK